ncbi:S53 family peptidase [Nocardioides baekrokdamisoli]|nr:S53 family peptidase [Nocardioides baekrokdamisoli]
MRQRTARYAAAFSLAAASLITVQGSPSAYAGTNPVEITLTLAAPNPTALAALAADTTGSVSERRAKLATLLPSAATHISVAHMLTSQGFRVLEESSWTMTVSAPQNLVTALFGLLPINPTTLTQALAPYPRVPTALAGLVRLANPTTTSVPAWHSSVVRAASPYDLRNAYTAPRVPPGAGNSRNGPLTVATIQFSDWNQNDLSRYAARMGRPDPVATRQLRTVRVDGGATDSNGQVEVGLDQEAILGVSPYSAQQLYSAPNSNAGFNDAFSAVLDDVLGNSHARVRNPRIAALSTSWGGCESATGISNIQAVQPILQSLVAAGVNIFAPAGDIGIYDCDNGGSGGGLLGGGLLGGPGPSAAVDFPASSPYVIGVGGTRLASATTSRVANSGSNWTETAWSCTSQSTCTGQGGTGGGQSTVFGTPAYQRIYVTAAPFAGRGRRLVPDIAADADPATGLLITTSDPAANSNGQLLVGGTSLATPVSAALFVDLLASLGRTRGVPDLHGGIYKAAAAKKFVRDVRSGSNGAAADAGNDPRVTAGIGYDTLTGVGSILWSGMAAYLPR